MEFKGTKGNWRIYNDFKVGTGVKNICEIYNNTSNESKANAKLIAAAPDLLEALQKIASNSNDHAMIRIAIKAIQKALK